MISLPVPPITAVLVRRRRSLTPASVVSAVDGRPAVEYLRLKILTEARSLPLAVNLQKSVLTAAEIGKSSERLNKERLISKMPRKYIPRTRFSGKLGSILQ